MINPEILKNKDMLIKGMKQPFLMLQNALIPEKAEQLYRELMAFKGWERQAIINNPAFPGFVYQRDTVAMGAAGAPKALNELHTFLSGQQCLEWVKEISGRLCDDFYGAAAVFKPGDQISEHSDRFTLNKDNGATAVRAVTFNYYLTKHWENQWGGRFVWKNPRTEILPSFNTLILFNVGSDTLHWVEPIAEGVDETRLSITGWFLTTTKQSPTAGKKLNFKI